MRGVFDVNVSPFLVGIYTSTVIVVFGGDLLLCKNSLTVNTCNVLGHLLVLFMVIVVKLAVKVRPVINCGRNTRGFNQIGRALGCYVVTKKYVASLKFTFDRLFPGLIIGVFASSGRLATLTHAKLRVKMLVFPFIKVRVMVSDFFRSVKGTGVSVFLSLSHRLLCLLPYLLLLPR